jgi:predicted RNase H-like HicB family nuclease
MFKYGSIIYWSNEDNVLVAEVPELPGCVAHGPSQDAALAKVNEAVQLWLDTAREFGDPVPEPKGHCLMPA